MVQHIPHVLSRQQKLFTLAHCWVGGFLILAHSGARGILGLVYLAWPVGRHVLAYYWVGGCLLHCWAGGVTLAHCWVGGMGLA